MNKEDNNLLAAIEDWWSANNAPVFDPQDPKVQLHHPTFGPEEIFALTRQTLTTYVTMGEQVKAFEKGFCSLLGYQHGVSNNSGSSANLLMLSALSNDEVPDHLRTGDEIIIPALTWSTSLWPVVQRGLIPVFVDSNPATLNIDPESIEKAIGPKTRAIMAVPVYGNPCDMDALADICKRHNLMLIEDCCESMGATYKGKAVGSFGRVASYSFYFSHHITTLEGGICVTEDPDLAELMRIIRAHGWVRQTENPHRWTEQHPEIDPKFLFVNEGYNLRITEPQAAMGLLQLDKLEGFVKARQACAKFYADALADTQDILAFQQVTDGATHSWFGFPLLISEQAGFSRNEICQYLNAKGIETRPIIAGNLAKQPGTKKFPYRIGGDLAGADRVMQSGFSIGCHQHLNQEALQYAADTIQDFLSGK